MEEQNRTLTDADVEAIINALRQKVIKQFYFDLGKGLWALLWRGVVMALIAIAAFGAVKGAHG